MLKGSKAQVGTSNGVALKGTGVSRFDGKNWHTYNSYEGLVYDNVTSIVIDSQGNKWFVTSKKGVSKFDDRLWTSYTTGSSNIEPFQPIK